MTLPELIKLLTKVGEGNQRNAEFQVTLPVHSINGTRVDLKFVLKDWTLFYVQSVPTKEGPL